MVISKIAICPICGKKTLIRIQDGGYLNEYPIRINCMNCKTLIKGFYSMNQKSSKLNLINAIVQEPTPEFKDYKTNDLNSIYFKDVDYIAEVSGELPCKFVKKYEGGLPLSPYMTMSTVCPSLLERINRFKEFIPSMDKWKKKKFIAFQLLDEGSIDYIAKALNNQMGKYHYDCDNYLKSLHCLQNVVLEESKYLFIEQPVENIVKKILSDLSTLDKNQINSFIKELGGTETLIYSYRRIIEVFSNFMNIYQNLLPAETYMYLNQDDLENKCISTCSFNDIKTFYQDAYESILSLMYIPVCMDNIDLRNDYNCFNKDFENVYCKNIRNLKWYKTLDNGTRINKLCFDEYYQAIIELPANRLLRNGIGHNNIKYNPLNQMVTAYDLKKENKINFEDLLINIAVDSLKLVKSSIIISEMILFLLREEFRKNNITTIIHPQIYNKTNPYDECPCGSGLKYKRCCMKNVETVIKENKNKYIIH